MSFRERLRRLVRAEQFRTQQQILDEVERLGGVPGVPLVVVDGKLAKRATPSLRL